MAILEVGPEAEVFVGETYASNATLFYSSQGTLMVDALASRADGEALRAHLEARQRPPRLIVLTHGFSDHMGGLGVFSGVPVLAHARVAETFAREAFRSAEEEGFWVEPTVRLDAPAELRWGCHVLRVQPLGGHTESTLGIDVPGLDAVMLGDSVVGKLVYLRYADRPALRSALEWGRSLRRRWLIQGHGGLHTTDAIDSALRYLDAFEDALERGRPSFADERWLEPGSEILPFEATFHARNLEMLRAAAK